jgi:P pilus assembly chaperone PapD
MNYSEFFKKISPFRPINIHFNFYLPILIIFFSVNLMAQGDLVIFPRRAVFEGNQRMLELNLANTGQDTARYVISFVQIRMKENGEFENITQPDSGQRFADSFIRFFPRTVILAPNEAQLLKLQLIRTNLLEPGEYRSHLYFRSIPEQKPLALMDKDSVKDSTAISVSLVPIFGITIPVIIRVGESTTKVTLSDLTFEMINDTIPTVKMIINRTGNMSVYGDIKVEYISPQGRVTQVGVVQGVAVYTPNLKRSITTRLKNLSSIDYRHGKLQIVYTAQREDKNAEYAEAELQMK